MFWVLYHMLTNLLVNFHELQNTSDIKSNIHGIDIRQMDGVQPFLLMDMGEVSPSNFTSVIAHLAHTQVIDYGVNGLGDNTIPTTDFGSIS